MKTIITTSTTLCALLLGGCAVGEPTSTFGDPMSFPPASTSAGTVTAASITTVIGTGSGSDSQTDSLDTGSSADTGSSGSDGPVTNTTGPGTLCGDGIVDGAEECDDGGESATCDADCTLAMCGDTTLNATAAEQCDDGGESATCNIDCTLSACGDGLVNATAAEECDDGNLVEDDGCKNNCTFFVSATCSDLLTNENVWGEVATGVDLIQWTSSQLHYIGCPSNGCQPGDFYCNYNAATQQLDFGTSSGSAMRSLVDPGNALGDVNPTTYSSCCSAPGGLCNAPDSNNNGVGVDMIAALCTALGYSGGTVIREVNTNFCPEPHVLDVDGQQWDSDFVDSDGFGAEYRCMGFL